MHGREELFKNQKFAMPIFFSNPHLNDGNNELTMHICKSL